MLSLISMDLRLLLAEIGLEPKESAVYLKLLTSGSCSIKKLAEAARLDRTRTTKILKSLAHHGLVSTFKRNKKVIYQAEDPEKLIDVIDQKERSMVAVKRQLTELMPEVRAIYDQGGNKPLVRHFEGPKGAALVLREVLHTVSKQSDKTYRSYSSAIIRKALYKEFPKFTKERIARKIRIKIISPAPGGHIQPLSERRWIGADTETGVHTIIFGSKLAVFSIDPKDDLPRATIIEDAGLTASQRLIFDQLWEKLG